MEPGDVYHVLRRGSLLILAFAIALGVLVFELDHLRSPVYKSSTSVLLSGNPNDVTDAGQGLDNLDDDQLNRLVATQIVLADSATVKAKAATLAKTTPADVSQGVTIAQSGVTGIIQISASRSTAADAQTVASAYAQAIINAVQNEATDNFNFAAKALDPQIEKATAQVTTVTDQLATASINVRPSLQQVLTTDTAQLDTLLASQQQLQSQAAATASEASIAVAASLPDAASSPKPKTDAVLAFLVGLVVGTGVLLLRELLRDNVHNLGHLDEIFAAPLVVELTRPRRRPLQALLQLAQGGSRGRDSYPSIRTLRVGLDMLAAEESSRVLVVTSARIDPQSAQLPKTLAEAFARAGQTTTLLDAGPIGEYMPNDLALADEPEPKATSLGRPGRVGLAEAGAKTSLSRTALLTRAAAKREPENAITHLHYGSPNDTRETDLHELIRELIRELAKSSSVVIVDASGLLEFPERALLMNDVDGIIIVSRAYHTKRPDLRRLRHALAFAQPKIAAAVMISR